MMPLDWTAGRPKPCGVYEGGGGGPPGPPGPCIVREAKCSTVLANSGQEKSGRTRDHRSDTVLTFQKFHRSNVISAMEPAAGVQACLSST